MGCSLQWIKDRDAVSEVTNQSYKYPKIDHGPVCDFHNHERKIFDINTSPGRQYEYSFLRDKNGTYPQQASLGYQQITIFYPSRSQLLYSQCWDKGRMETLANRFWENWKWTYLHRDYAISFLNICIEARPEQYRNKCNATGLKQKSQLCLFAILYDKSNFGHWAMSGKKSSYIWRNLLHNERICPTWR